MIEFDILKILYKNLSFQLQNTKRRKNKSILFDMMKVKSNDRINLLRDSAEDLTLIDTTILEKLLSKEFVRENEIGNYYITARGIWAFESEEKDLTEELIVFFDQEFFTNKSVGKGLSDKEKVILVSLVAIRSFCNETALDLRKTDLIKDSFAEILLYFNEKLSEYGVLKKRTKNFLGDAGNEHRVSKMIRHSDELPKKTRMMYKNGFKSEQKYFINVSQDMVIKEEDLKYIMSRVFEEAKLDYLQIKEFNNDLKRLAYYNGPNIYSDMSKSFIQPQFDMLISTIVEEAIMGL